MITWGAEHWRCLAILRQGVYGLRRAKSGFTVYRRFGPRHETSRINACVVRDVMTSGLAQSRGDTVIFKPPANDNRRLP